MLQQQQQEAATKRAAAKAAKAAKAREREERKLAEEAKEKERQRLADAEEAKQKALGEFEATQYRRWRQEQGLGVAAAPVVAPRPFARPKTLGRFDNGRLERELEFVGREPGAARTESEAEDDSADGGAEGKGKRRMSSDRDPPWSINNPCWRCRKKGLGCVPRKK